MTFLEADKRAESADERAQSKIASRLSAEIIIGIIFASLVIFLLVFRPLLTTHDPMQGDLMLRFQPPGTEGHWLGTDELGRDMWSRVLAGLQWSMSAAVTATALAFAIGTFLGLLAARFPGIVRTVIRQSIDTVLSFPGLIVAICVIAVFGQGFQQLVLTLGLLSWPVFARVVYAEALSLLEREYVLNAQLIGVGQMAILYRHVLPGLRATLMVMLAFHFADMLIAESALSFLGIGAPLGEPTWGNMLAASRDKLFQAPWMMLVPASAIVLAVVTANLVGDGIATVSRRLGKGIDL